MIEDNQRFFQSVVTQRLRRMLLTGWAGKAVRDGWLSVNNNALTFAERPDPARWQLESLTNDLDMVQRGLGARGRCDLAQPAIRAYSCAGCSSSSISPSPWRVRSPTALPGDSPHWLRCPLVARGGRAAAVTVSRGERLAFVQRCSVPASMAQGFTKLSHVR